MTTKLHEIFGQDEQIGKMLDKELHGESTEDSEPPGFNEWYQAAYDFADVNLNIPIPTLNSGHFEKEAREAFAQGADPYAFVSEWAADRHGFTEGRRGYDPTSEFEPWDIRKDAKLDGSAADAPPWPGSKDGSFYDRMERDSIFGPSKGTCPECGGAGISIQGPQGQYDECPKCTPGLKQEAHGERAAQKSKNFDKRPEKGPSLDDFGGPDPEDKMFFGNRDIRDISGREDQVAWEDPGSENKFGSESPETEPGALGPNMTSRYHPDPEEDGVGPSVADPGNSGAQFDYASGQDPDLVDAEWNSSGQRDGAGKGVRFAKYDPNDGAVQTNWWGGKKRPDYVPPKSVERGNTEMQGVGEVEDKYRVIDRETGKVLGSYPDYMDAYMHAYRDADKIPLIDVEEI